MSLRNLNILAVIPARSGSKGIPRKNLREINGKSLIEHAARCVQALDWIDATIVSTDSEEIITHAQNLDIDAPFIRPKELSGDNAKSIDMWKHAWTSCENYYQIKFDISVLLEPTSPLRTPDDISNCVELLLDGKTHSVATVSKTPAHYTPQKTLNINAAGIITPYLEGGLKYSIRQEIPDYYHRNGICYATTRKSLLELNNLMEKSCSALVINRPVVNIDEEIDLKLAELLMKAA